MRGEGGGPKSARGKAASSRNAIKHGLRATAPVVRQVESVEDWERHLDGVIAATQPEGYLEAQLAVRIAGVLWRLRRVAHYEAEKISIALDQMPEDYADTLRYGSKVTDKPFEESMTLEKIEMQTGIRMVPEKETLDLITRGACPEQSRPQAADVEGRPTSTASSSRRSTSSKRCRPAAKANAHL